jgi:hypothetical protein
MSSTTENAVDALRNSHWDHLAILRFVTEPSVDMAQLEFGAWIRRLEQRAQGRVDWFIAIERDDMGLLRLRVLLRGTDRLALKALTDAWLKRGASVRRCSSEPRVASYLNLRNGCTLLKSGSNVRRGPRAHPTWGRIRKKGIAAR